MLKELRETPLYWIVCGTACVLIAVGAVGTVLVGSEGFTQKVVWVFLGVGGLFGIRRALINLQRLRRRL